MNGPLTRDTRAWLRRVPFDLLAAIVIFVLAAAVYFAWGVSDRMGLVTGDGPNYLMMAKSYAHGGQDRVAAEAASTSRFPPLYPLVLARAGGGDSLRAAHVATIVFFPLALVAFYLWQRVAGLARGSALLLTCAAAGLPEAWLSALNIQSEYQYLALSLAALALLAKYRTTPVDTMLYGATLCIVLAILTRTIGIVLAVPLLAALWRATARQRIVAVAIVALPLIAWYALHRPQNGGYAAAVLGQISVSSAWRVLLQQASALRAGTANALLLHPPALVPLADVLIAIVAIAALVRAWLREPDGLYACAYVAVLALWPFPNDVHRLIWPLLPVLLAQAPLAARAMLRSHNPEFAARLTAASCAALIFAMAMPSITHAWQRHAEAERNAMPEMSSDPSWYWSDENKANLYAAMEAGLVGALHRLGELVPADQCVIATRADWINFYAGRRSVAPPPHYASDPAFDAAIGRSGCDYVFAGPFSDPFYSEPMYPLRRLADRVEILDRTPLPGQNAQGEPLEFVLAKIRR